MDTVLPFHNWFDDSEEGAGKHVFAPAGGRWLSKRLLDLVETGRASPAQSDCHQSINQ